jgi:PAS domain S-box-containing protein
MEREMLMSPRQDAERALSAAPLDLFCVVNLGGYFTYASPEFERTLGYSPQELAGRRVHDFIDPDDLERVQTAGQELVRSGEEYRTESRWIRRDGSGRWLRWAGWFDTRTRLIYATSRDITDSRGREEQAALRRVATLVAKATSPAEVFEAVTAEMRQLLGVDGAMLVRFEDEGSSTVMAHDVLGGPRLAAGTRLPVEADSIIAEMRRTGRSVRRDGPEPTPAALKARVRERGLIGAAKAPVVVQGRIWGYAGIAWRQPVPADTEARMVQFTELVGTAIANADSRDQLDASRARVVAAADEARQRIERDLHDGVQQRLVALALDLRELEARSPVQGDLARIGKDLGVILDDLREIVQGIHPPVLRRAGLSLAVRTLARRSRIPARLDVRVHGRLPAPAEVAAYQLVAEALANAAKHSAASVVEVEAEARQDVLLVVVSDDGVGGADPSQGSGLIGLQDRVEALGGTFCVQSPPGGGTMVRAEIPLRTVPLIA